MATKRSNKRLPKPVTTRTDAQRFGAYVNLVTKPNRTPAEEKQLKRQRPAMLKSIASAKTKASP